MFELIFAIIAISFLIGIAKFILGIFLVAKAAQGTVHAVQHLNVAGRQMEQAMLNSMAQGFKVLQEAQNRYEQMSPQEQQQFMAALKMASQNMQQMNQANQLDRLSRDRHNARMGSMIMEANNLGMNINPREFMY